MEKQFNERIFKERMSSDEFEVVANIDNKLVVHKHKGDTGGCYEFSIWDEKSQQYGFNSCTIEVFCSSYLRSMELAKKLSSKTIETDSIGARQINKEQSN